MRRKPCRGKRIESDYSERLALARDVGVEFDDGGYRFDFGMQPYFAVKIFVDGAADAFDAHIGFAGNGAKRLLHFGQRRIVDQIHREAQRHPCCNRQYRKHAAAGTGLQGRQ